MPPDSTPAGSAPAPTRAVPSHPAPAGLLPATPADPQCAVRVEGLVKRYGSQPALHGLDLDVRRGEVFGFLGPNGAGKTTTVRILLDLIRPTAGRVSVLGLDPRANGTEVRARVGYLPSDLPFTGRQTGQELVEFLGRLRGGVSPARIRALADRLGLDLSRPVRALSRGNRQKVGLLQAFMPEPELLVLDEPSTGLDPLVQREFLAMVREARDGGRTVFMSSHILSEIQEAADRVAIIRAGRLVTVAGVRELRERASRRVEVRFGEEEEVGAADFAGLPGIRDVVLAGHLLRCLVVGRIDPLVKALARFGVDSMVVEEPDLEEIFLAEYGAGSEASQEGASPEGASPGAGPEMEAERAG